MTISALCCVLSASCNGVGLADVADGGLAGDNEAEEGDGSHGTESLQGWAW